MTQPSPYSDLSTLTLPGYEGEILDRYADGTGRHWLAGLQQQLLTADAQLLYRQRNRVYRLDDPISPQPAALCIKAFKRPDTLRGLIYRRTGSKAQRAHCYSKHLYSQGAAVAEPIGYMEKWQGTQLVESYLITRYVANSTDLYSEMTYLLNEHPNATDFIALLRFSADAIRTMHDSGFLHGDLGPQNLLMTRTGPANWAQPTFIDLNRGQLQSNPTLRQRAKDMERMKIPSHFRRIFFHLYFRDDAIPVEFLKWSERYHNRFLLHQRSRKWRHPVRSIKSWLSTSGTTQRKAVSTGQPSPRDVWLWDAKSAQPSVMLRAQDRRRHRSRADIGSTVLSNLRKAWPIYRAYQVQKAEAFQRPVVLTNRLGVCVEVEDNLTKQLAQLKEAPGLPVFVRLYFHQGPGHLERCHAAIRQLSEAGHEVSIGLIQSRQAVIKPDRWHAFVSAALAPVHTHIHCVEIGHAVNRVKWGLWNLTEMNDLWQPVPELKTQYPKLIFLGPAVNDFELQYYAPLLDRHGPAVDALSNHLYVDRRGAPETAQSGFSTLEKCLLAKAIANTYHKPGFYITEVNWPLQNTGDYSPLAGAYQPKNKQESPLHISEQDSAAFMIRYALIALCSGTTERIWWWRLSHPGFGLIDDLNGWRERPGWLALQHWQRTLQHETFQAREEKGGAVWWHFDTVSLVYALEPTVITVPTDIKKGTDLTGKAISFAPASQFTVNGQPIYLHR
ncbi:MAG: lipopolysaccharide kinase InaA family protein [Natronospirillum sp.]